MKEKKKPKYNMLQNIWWMVKIAWKVRVRVLVFVVLMATLEVLYNLTQLYIAPEILRRVEEQVALDELLGTIGIFTVALFLIMGLKEYISEIAGFPWVDVRSYIIGKIARKCNVTSYPNNYKTDFIKLRDRAYLACNGNREATEYIWTTLTNLLKNIGGFAVYLTILSDLDVWMIGLILFTCIAGFFVSLYVNTWRYAHRDEEDKIYAQKLYIRGSAESLTLAKDIRIFGLQNWLNDLNTNIHDIYRDFRFRFERKLILGDVTEAVLTIARNGIAYVYLIHLTLEKNLSISEFLLYFTAVSTFTMWVTGILQELTKLHQESIDISCVREFLEYPESFAFEEGKGIPEADGYELKLENVSFRYPEAETDTIHNLNLTMRPGEKLAIVGLNGAGKTTLVKLLCGLLDPTEGRVLLNGQDIRQFNRREYYGLFSAVFQEFSVLDVTIAENIAQNNEDIDIEKVWNCIEKAGLTATISEGTVVEWK